MQHCGWDNLGDWSEPRAAYEDAAAALARRLWGLSGAEAGARVLDVGCGFGAQLAVWRGAGAADVLALEPDKTRATAAAARFADDPAVTVQEAGAARGAALDENSRDLVLVVDALYHFEARARFFSDCRRVLASDGALAFCTIVAPGARRSRAMWNAVGRAFEMPDGVPTERELRAELANAGLGDVRVEDWTDAVLHGFAAHGSRALAGGEDMRRRLRVQLTRVGCRRACAAGLQYLAVQAA